ncbi:ATP phosphoribosyltransferase regulatory subunit [Hydrogenoanaerobacterium saccharovorans]|uniref:ATP phosphoribosyltransferase regulatory subunit n=1 Tax=Hydrogenoanaerobacterium saccharovorans TaxID=474960 RepID=A0A1H7ZBY9_9FIRM|nr:ATP phosphoribosyltransferase regulatory subunit [Hydrogenoanaerobacterium saccharovorans]RPF48700.1 ATP phosphoribosyltransferase regulatory subunit [Hydrogenoanaerobacterium saccharovorans]SEM55826.1 ATP phosphoribosyltransferase regulatory subunit [Hydrogenoanaerobacterium saccharovorans]
MDLFLGNLKDEERVTFQLRKLFEHHGYKKVRVHKFEEYSLYIDNKNFLKTENIITFMDLDGKLLALRPDVTLSIVKNLDAQKTDSFEKLYYLEKVYRLSRQNREYKEIGQMGLECIGKIDEYATIEVIRLAVKSLGAISENYLLDISHMGFLSGLLEGIAIDEQSKYELAKCIRAKNIYELKTRLDKIKLSDFYKDKLLQIPQLYGDFNKVLLSAQALVVNDTMQKALDELKTLYTSFEGTPLSQKLNLDISIVNDLDYYNGIIFQGYVENIPKAVLAGGQYDNLLHKLGKDKGAIGFAVYLDELEQFYRRDINNDADVLVLYDTIDNYKEFSALIEDKIAQGLRVRVERVKPQGLRCKTVLRYANSELKKEDI